MGSRSRGERLRVAVLMGGPSEEHEVSLQGGQNVTVALAPHVFQVRPVYIAKDGPWSMPPRSWRAPRSQDGARFDARDRASWRTYAGACEALVELRAWRTDVAIPVLHGRFGEDGTVQACLASAGIRYVGSDAPASAAAFDKVRTKEILGFHGIDTPEFEVVEARDLAGDRSGRVADWARRLGLPLVLKNPLGGSTLEVRIAADERAAVSAIEELVPPAERLLIERHVAGRELTVGVLEDRTQAPRALPVVEIRPRGSSFFDYQQKYAADGAEELCPAPIPPDVADRAQHVALAAHRILRLRGLSRTDMIWTGEGALRVLEVNTLPGMTSRGLVPLAASVAGVSFPDLLAGLVRGAHLPAA